MPEFNRPVRNRQGSAKFKNWVCLSEQIKENNHTIRNLTGEYKKIESDCWKGVRAQLERMKELCKKRNNLYEKQNDLKGQKWKIGKSLER